ncbi:MAG: lipopolysaccharide biosynthesis protein, partial [Oxalobacteraceae bacterium]
NYWALFFGGLAGAAASSLMMWVSHGWRPQWRPGIKAARTMIGFGANVTGFNLVNFLARNADNVLIARFSGAAAVGLYDRSYKLMLFPLQNINAPMSRVMVPALSRLQDHPERYRRAYLLSLRALVLVSMPGVIAIAIASRPVVLLLLGQKWQSAVPIFFWLSLTAIVQIVANTTGWLFISSGRAREMMRWGLVSSLVSIASFIVGLPWGPVGVAKAYFASQVVCLPFLYWYSCKQSPIDYESLYRLQLPTVAGGLVAWLLSRNIPGESGVSYILPIVVLSYVCCWISELIFPEGRQALKEYIVMVRKATS